MPKIWAQLLLQCTLISECPGQKKTLIPTKALWYVSIHKPEDTSLKPLQVKKHINGPNFLSFKHKKAYK